MIADFKKKQKKSLPKNILLSLGGILILIVFIFLVAADIKVYQKKRQLIYQTKILENKIEDLKSKNNDLKQNILKENDNTHIEKIAREELDLKKPGEKVFSFVTPDNQDQKNEEKQKNILQIWTGWISNGWNWIKDSF